MAGAGITMKLKPWLFPVRFKNSAQAWGKSLFKKLFFFKQRLDLSNSVKKWEINYMQTDRL